MYIIDTGFNFFDQFISNEINMSDTFLYRSVDYTGSRFLHFARDPM